MSEESLVAHAPPAADPGAIAPVPRESAAMTAVRFVALLYSALLVLVIAAVLVAAALLSWRPFLVTSGSMVPAMRPGDVVVVEPAAPGSAFDPPTIITFHDADRGLVTHRIVGAVRAADGEVRYTTKGDANADPESGTVGQGDVVGSVRYVLRGAGMPLLWLQTGRTGPFGAWAVASLAAIWLALGLLRARPAEGTATP